MDFRKLFPARVNPICRSEREKFIVLDNGWDLRLDPQDIGKSEKWFENSQKIDGKIDVPGSIQGQGFGFDKPEKVMDFDLDVQIFNKTYQGTAWYKKCFFWDEFDEDERIWLKFGGVHPAAEVWMNGIYIGSHEGAFIPFAFDISETVLKKRENVLVVRIYEKDRYLGGIYDWFNRWSGIYRNVELAVTGDSYIEDCWLHADAENSRLIPHVRISGKTGSNLSIEYGVYDPDGIPVKEGSFPVEQSKDKDGIVFQIYIPDLKLWSIDNPYLYKVEVKLKDDVKILDSLMERVGFRQLATHKNHILLNGTPIYMRGVDFWLMEPETVSPCIDRDELKRRIRLEKDFGFNYCRFQTTVPTPEYIEAADELGFLIQGEMGFVHGINGPEPIPNEFIDQDLSSGGQAFRCFYIDRNNDHFIQKQQYNWYNTVIRDRNHPSMAIYCLSNEISFESIWDRFAKECYYNTKKLNPGIFVMYTDGFRHSHLPSDIHNCFTDGPGNFDPDNDRLFIEENPESYDKPVIEHEFRWWTSYPDTTQKNIFKKAMTTQFYEMIEEKARDNGYYEELPEIVEASKHLQAVERKLKMEWKRRTRKYIAGIGMFSIKDILVSPQGLVNEVYDVKLATPREFLKTNGDTVILVDMDEKERVFSSGGIYKHNLYISDYSSPTFKKPTLRWELFDGRSIICFSQKQVNIDPYTSCKVETVEFTVPEVSRGTKMELRAFLQEDGRKIENNWALWVFPKSGTLMLSDKIFATVTELDGMLGFYCERNPFIKNFMPDTRTSGTIILSEVLTTEIFQHVADGASLFLFNYEYLPIYRFYGSQFGWFEGKYFKSTPAHYMRGYCGALLDGKHPIFREFPNEGFADLQFYQMIATNAPPLNLKFFPDCLKKPIIRMMGDYRESKPQAHMIEGRLGKGKVIISTLKFRPDNPASVYLMDQVLNYMQGEEFKPGNIIDAEILEKCIADEYIV